MSLLLDSMDLETLEINTQLAPTDEELLVIRCPLEPIEIPCNEVRKEEDHDWFEMALKTEAPAARPTRNSWGDDEEESDEESPDEESTEEGEEPDPFEDFDEEDFDDDFDDDFEEELEDEYEIEPKDDGFAIEENGDDSDSELNDDDESDMIPGDAED